MKRNAILFVYRDYQTAVEKVTNSVLIMLRYPVAGKAKTRLAAAMGPEKAAEFYRICARQVLREMGNLPAQVSRYVFFTDSTDQQDVEEWAGPGFNFKAQAGKDLGERLINAFTEVFSEGVGKAVIIASDVPDISADIINQALEVLDCCDIVLGPSHDGGYYLLGMSKLHRELFQGIPWSSPEVMERTLARADETGLTACLLPTLIDIDNFEDFKMWLSLCSNRNKAMADFISCLNPS
ncbi:MAG: TIGR04282 family arsenosugar biosynthesis glycosyltransferase [Dehalococcoidia bacterium]|jgi:rSAM/selenodomain-associated transferase 1